ncbi:MAG: helix-turn-helix domain-containing protein [Thermoleophilia bacterium]|nr:helix-turn-helix domain-containing protein [Thermoleophilia bacterium]
MKSPSGEIPNSRLAFSDALRQLLKARGMSYRRLATRTRLSAGYLNHLACGSRPVPSDQVIKILARALRVKPEHFFEFRMRRLMAELNNNPELADRLHEFLAAGEPLPRDIKAALEDVRKSK